VNSKYSLQTHENKSRRHHHRLDPQHDNQNAPLKNAGPNRIAENVLHTITVHIARLH